MVHAAARWRVGCLHRGCSQRVQRNQGGAPGVKASLRRLPAGGVAIGGSGVRGHIVAVLVLAVSVPLAGCSEDSVPAAAPTRSADVVRPVASIPAVPDVVDVTCSAAGISVSSVRVAARADGVHVRIRNTSGVPDVYLNRSYGPLWRLAGGDRIGPDGSVQIFSMPPGPVRLDCSAPGGSERSHPVRIDVEDPARAWRTGALDRWGCEPPERSLVDWVIGPASGPTAAAALAALVAKLDQPTTWLAAQEGYVDAVRQTYVLMRQGKAWVTGSVTRVSDGTFSAGLAGACRGTF